MTCTASQRLSTRLITLLPVTLLLALASLPAAAITVAPVVSQDWLAKHLDEPDLAIIEVSEIAAFEFDGHIPGAVYTNKSEWRYQAPDTSLVHHDTDKLQQMIRALGVNQGDGVVIYYRGSEVNEALGAFYLVWLFNYLGHTNVGILDQGWSGWLRADGVIEEDAATPEPGDFTGRPLGALEISIKELEQIRAFYPVIDGRPPTHFTGQDKFPANPAYGRIEDSLSQPWQDYLHTDDDGLIYMQAPVIPTLLKERGYTKGQPLLLTCLGGTGAAVNYVMFYNAGFHNLRLDDAGLRSWNEQKLPLVKD